MDRSKGCKDGSLVFLTEENAECCIRLMTLFQENVVVDAEFMKPSHVMEREWLQSGHLIYLSGQFLLLPANFLFEKGICFSFYPFDLFAKVYYLRIRI
jgi:hypothetical protein